MKKNNKNKQLVSAAFLPSDYIINDPKSFIYEMKSSLLRKIRERKGLSLEHVSGVCEISVFELQRIESGKVNEQDLSVLFEISELYKIDYHSLLFMFKLAGPNASEKYGIAAFHDQHIDSDTQEQLKKIIEKLGDNE